MIPVLVVVLDAVSALELVVVLFFALQSLPCPTKRDVEVHRPSRLLCLCRVSMHQPMLGIVGLVGLKWVSYRQGVLQREALRMMPSFASCGTVLGVLQLLAAAAVARLAW